MGFAIPITIGGLLQIMCQVQGYRYIREFQRLRRLQREQPQTVSNDEVQSLQEAKDNALGNHIGYMVNLFVMACSIPAGIRLASLLTGKPDGVSTIAAIVAIVFALQSVATRYVNKLVAPLGKSRNNEKPTISEESVLLPPTREG